MMKLTITILFASLLTLALAQAASDSDSDVELSSDDMEALLDSDSDEGGDDRKTEEGCTRNEVWHTQWKICTPRCGSGEEVVFEDTWSVKSNGKCNKLLSQDKGDECYNDPTPVCDRVCYAPAWKRTFSQPGKPSIRARSPKLPIKGCTEQRDENGCGLATREVYLPETGQCKPPCPSGQEYVFSERSKTRMRVISPVCARKCNTPQERRITLTNQKGASFGIDKCEDMKGCFEWAAWGANQYPACKVTTDGSKPSTVGPLCHFICNRDNHRSWKYVVPVQKNGYRERKCLKGPRTGETARESVKETKQCCSNPMTDTDAPHAACSNQDTSMGQHKIFTKKARGLDTHIHIMNQRAGEKMTGIPTYSSLSSQATAAAINSARSTPYQCSKWKFTSNKNRVSGVQATCWQRCSKTCVPKGDGAATPGAPGVWKMMFQPKWQVVAHFKCIDDDGPFGKEISKKWHSTKHCCGQAKGRSWSSTNKVMNSIQKQSQDRPECRIGEMIFGDFNTFRVSEYK